MSVLITKTAEIKTMSSREISELVESRHDSVKRSMETLQDKGVISFTQSVETSHDGAGARPVEVYVVGKRDSYVVVAQLSPEFTARLVDRWQELENQAPKPIALSRMDLIKMAMESEEQRLALEAKVAEVERDSAKKQEMLELAAPKVEFVDRYVNSTGLKGFRQVAKLLQVKEPEFRDFLKNEKIMYQLGGEWTALSHHVDAGRFVVKAGTSDISGHAFNNCKFTPKGVAWVAGQMASRRASFALSSAGGASA